MNKTTLTRTASRLLIGALGIFCAAGVYLALIGADDQRARELS